MGGWGRDREWVLMHPFSLVTGTYIRLQACKGLEGRNSLPHTHRAASGAPYSMGSCPYGSLSTRLVILPFWKSWLGKIGPLREAESCWLLWVDVSPSPAQREGAPMSGWIPYQHMLPLVAGCTRQKRSPDSMVASAAASSWWPGITV